MSRRDIGESMEFGVMAGIALAGVNMVWGIFLLPWGVIGMVFAALNVLTAFMLRSTKQLYVDKDYEKARSRILFLAILGFITGFLIYGYYLYLIYSALDDIVIRKYLVRGKEKPIEFAPPYIPKK